MKKLIKVLELIFPECGIVIHRNEIKMWLTGSEMQEAPVSYGRVER